MSSIANYAIAVLRPNGQWDTCNPSSQAFSYLASSITITLGMLSTPMAQQALTLFAFELDRILARPAHSTGFRNLSRAHAGEVVRIFLSKLHSRFPVVIIDQQLPDHGALGYMRRGGSDNDFDPRHHNIHVNAKVGG